MNRKNPNKLEKLTATYLDRLGTASAKEYAPVIKRQASSLGVALPVSDDNVQKLLENTIEGLEKMGLLDWNRTPDVRRDVFVQSWADEMTRQGVRA